MTASKQLKGLLAGLATVAVVGTAIAQGTPPNPNKANPATGAGQQSSQQTPMGMTGVQPSGAATATSGASGTTGSSSTMGASGSTSGSASTPSAASSPSTSGSTSGSSSTMGAGPTDTTTSGTTGGRAARADRN